MKRQATLFCAVLVLAGCGRVPPPLTEVDGTVFLDGKPLPNAAIEFVPELTQFGAEMNSHAITDDQGHYKLVCAFKEQPGAAVAKHRVLVTDPPPPAAARGMG